MSGVQVRSVPRWVVTAVGLGVLAAAAVWLWLPRSLVEQWWRSLPHFGQGIQAWMAANWLSFGMGQVLVASTGVLPASFIAVMAGASFGLVKGTLISAAATMFGGWLAFRLSRGMLRGFIARHIERYSSMVRLNEGMAREGWRFVMLLRVSPVMPFAVTSYALGLTRIADRDFLLGTIASLPALVGYVAIGALGKQGVTMAEGHASLAHWGALAIGMALLVYALKRVRKAMQHYAA